jgi:hypothetical protein
MILPKVSQNILGHDIAKSIPKYPRPWQPLDRRGRANLSAIHEELNCTPKGMPATLASLNNDYNSDLRAYYVGMRFSSRPNLAPASPLRPRRAA